MKILKKNIMYLIRNQEKGYFKRKGAELLRFLQTKELLDYPGKYPGLILTIDMRNLPAYIRFGLQQNSISTNSQKQEVKIFIGKMLGLLHNRSFVKFDDKINQLFNFIRSPLEALSLS